MRTSVSGKNKQCRRRRCTSSSGASAISTLVLWSCVRGSFSGGEGVPVVISHSHCTRDGSLLLLLLTFSLILHWPDVRRAEFLQSAGPRGEEVPSSRPGGSEGGFRSQCGCGSRFGPMQLPPSLSPGRTWSCRLRPAIGWKVLQVFCLIYCCIRRRRGTKQLGGGGVDSGGLRCMLALVSRVLVRLSFAWGHRGEPVAFGGGA